MLTIMKLAFIAVSIYLAMSASSALAASQTLQFDGRFEHRTDPESQEIIGNQICFYPSVKSSSSLPRAPEDRRLPWFCFSETESAAKQLQISLQAPVGVCGTTGTATVEVDNYKVYSGEGDDNDLASLRMVLKQSKPLPLPCWK